VDIPAIKELNLRRHRENKEKGRLTKEEKEKKKLDKPQKKVFNQVKQQEKKQRERFYELKNLGSSLKSQEELFEILANRKSASPVPFFSKRSKSPFESSDWKNRSTALTFSRQMSPEPSQLSRRNFMFKASVP